MNKLTIFEGIRIQSRVRAFELPAELSPDSDEGFDQWWPEIRHMAKKKFQGSNRVCDAALDTIARIMVGDASAVQTGRLYQQAMGTSPVTPTGPDVNLTKEMYRKPMSSVTRQAGNLVVASTYFTPTEFYSAETTIVSSTSRYDVTVNSVLGFRVGDLAMVASSKGFVYVIIESINAGTKVITFPTANALPSGSTAMVGGEMAQVFDEAGMFGNQAVATAAVRGLATFISVSANVAASVDANGNNAAWSSAQVGEYIRRAFPTDTTTNPPTPAKPGPWMQIASVTNATNLVLTTLAGDETAPTGNTGPVPYAIRGTMMNHVAGLRLVKRSTRGIVFENDWTLVSA